MAGAPANNRTARLHACFLVNIASSFRSFGIGGECRFVARAGAARPCRYPKSGAAGPGDSSVLVPCVTASSVPSPKRRRSSRGAGPLGRRRASGRQHTFNDIRRGVPLMSQTLLSARLKELERVGIVERRGAGAAGRIAFDQFRTGACARHPAAGRMGAAIRPGPAGEDELDVTIMIWNIRRRVDPDVFAAPHHRAIRIQRGAPGQKIMVDRQRSRRVDLCPKDPGFPVDLYSRPTFGR